jgi:hypothetical protein
MRVYLRFKARRCVTEMLLIEGTRLNPSPSQNTLAGALEEFQSYRPLSSEMFQREQVNPFSYVSVTTVDLSLVRKCIRRFCPLCRRRSNEQFYPSSKRPQLSVMLPKCSNER